MGYNLYVNKYKNVDEYIANFPEQTQVVLEKVRSTIIEVLPDAEERISYGIPTYSLPTGNIVHFGGYPKHIGFYPGSGAITDFAELLKGYETSKGTIRFPLDKPIPYDLIQTITKACAKKAGTSLH